MDEKLQRTELLLGSDAMQRVRSIKVILFGVGGVGSWCAESLVRCGVRHLTIVDSDRVSESNINRQLLATTATVGRVKVDVMRERLLEIAPDAEIKAIEGVYSPETSASFHLEEYDVILDAIDSLSNKADLIMRACETQALFVSSMGAALKMDISQVRLAEFWETKGCPLARALRKKFKREHCQPSRRFMCVYSPELQENKGTIDPDSLSGWDVQKGQINGTLVFVTATFGLMMASEVVRELAKLER